MQFRNVYPRLKYCGMFSRVVCVLIGTNDTFGGGSKIIFVIIELSAAEK